jgi:hypothetical protein
VSHVVLLELEDRSLLIRQKRIRRLDRHLSFPRGAPIRIGVAVAGREALLQKAGFGEELSPGERILPSDVFGPVSRFNANGKNLVHRDRDMETAYRMVEWHWVEWHGPYRHDRSDFREVPYKRYPRTFVPPPSVELTIVTNATGSRMLTSPVMAYADENKELLLHTVNLFLEIFGACQVFSQDLVPLVQAPVRRLNWELLPRGRWPWERLQTQLSPIIRAARRGNQAVIEERFRVVNAYGPEFVAVGRAGFRGYVVFGFPDYGIYVLESAYFGNATYVFDHRWEEFSQLTKAEVLAGDLQEERLVHRAKWPGQLRQLFEKHAA